MADEMESTLDEQITEKLVQLNTILTSMVDLLDVLGTTVVKISQLRIFNGGKGASEEFEDSMQNMKDWIDEYIGINTVEKLQEAFDDWWLSDLIKLPNLIEDMIGSCVKLGKGIASASEGMFSEGTKLNLPKSWRDVKNLLGQSNSYDIF